ncbi:hypothetical protein M441DRAFT_299269 [Trichoderma asperellum CBS 433.97]|uniref:Uncharacterized protein n=1 Tax=Trichoderma asperellum (strain ATCC 204424 / CBS 433.97 / NBRC 101777) TaxID=1042311 RepID=A0A2T3ZJ23_TRIA4|nr:hypothetical protein M441DRAFT_299269 [Trichoderma asperellum CBS 433.97]PTB44809.1 hypothetical protein M441DRAFT_299269 [Trichoderma asperellum CBS 433.97]
MLMMLLMMLMKTLVTGVMGCFPKIGGSDAEAISQKSSVSYRNGINHAFGQQVPPWDPSSFIGSIASPKENNLGK